MKKIFYFFVIYFSIVMPFNFSKAENLVDRLSGKILLQVEDAGQAWYVDPVTKQRAFLGYPADAFLIMRELGLGISESNYELFKKSTPHKLSGKILLRTEANGEAYYVNPDNLKMHYLGRPIDAFNVMRENGLGITNKNLNMVPVFQKYKEKILMNTDISNQNTENQQDNEEESEEKVNRDEPTNSLCSNNIWSCSDWSLCSASGQQTRTCNLTYNCQNDNEPAPLTLQNCIPFAYPTCTSWDYSGWSECSTDGYQTRNIISSLPHECSGGNPQITQSCSIALTCSCNDIGKECCPDCNGGDLCGGGILIDKNAKLISAPVDCTTNNTCSITEGNTKSWDGAMSKCFGLSINNFDDWHLPTLEELNYLYDYRVGHVAFYSDNSFMVGTNYWSATPYSQNNSKAWLKNFSTKEESSYGGNPAVTNKTSQWYVRCVRYTKI
jgi:hypothetical protein